MSKLVPIAGEQVSTPDAFGNVPDPVGQPSQIVPIVGSPQNVSQQELDVQDEIDDVGAFQNFSNAFQRSLITGSAADLSELVGAHDAATALAKRADREAPVLGSDDDFGTSKFLGETLGSIAPVVPALVFPALVLPVMAYFGLRAMGAGRGAVRAYEDMSGEDVSATTEAAVAAGYGLAVFVTEKIGLGGLKGVANKLAPKALKNIAGAYATGSSKATAQVMIREIGTVPLKGALVEGGQEGLEQTLTNLIDVTYGAKNIDDVLQGVPESIAMGAAGGGFIGAASLGVQATNINKEIQKTSVQRDLQKRMPNMEYDEVTNVSGFVNSFSEQTNLTPKQTLAQIETSETGLNDLREQIDLLHRTAKKSRVDSFVGNSIPLFRNVATGKQMNEIEDWLGLQQGAKWTNKDAKKFRTQLEKLMIDEDVSKGTPVEALESYKNWMGAVSAFTFNTGFLAGAKAGTINFVDQVHGASEQAMNNPFSRQQAANHEAFKRSYLDVMIDKVDTRAVFNRADAPKTGDALTNMASVQDVNYKKTEGIAKRLSQALRKGGFKLQTDITVGQEADANVAPIVNQLPLILEDRKLLKQLPQVQQDALAPVIKIWDDYIDGTLAALKEEGALEQGFFEQMKDQLEEQKTQAKSGDIKVLNKIEKQLENIKGAKFVPIPYRAWFSEMMVNNPRKLFKILQTTTTKGRKTVFIRDLIKQKAIKLEDINIFEILSNYGGRFGKDIAILKVKSAALSEGMMKPREKGTALDSRGGFHRAPKSAPILKDTQIRGPLADSINDIIRYRNNLSIVDKGLSMTKMGQFINPFFLPIYDMVQATMLGSINIFKPIRSGKNIVSAIRDVATQSQAWYDAGMKGARSTPYASPIENLDRSIKQISEHPNVVVRSLSGLLSRDVFREAYNISWNTAWFLDGFLRQISYRHLTDSMGYAPEEAGRIAALYHGDYAGVPANTRRALNRIFFTPTFKISMGKLFTKMIKESMSVSLKGGKILTQKALGKTPTVKITKEERLHTASLARTIGLIGAMDILFVSFMGFERDQWSRRYVKKDVETSEGTKDVVFTMSNPANMFLKYAFRAQEAFGDPSITQPMMEFLAKNSWELHPVWRMAMNLWNNKKSNGEIIVPTLANIETKASRTAWYMMREASALIDEIATVTSGQTDEAITSAIVEQEFGKFAEMAARIFAFTYLRPAGQSKKARQVSRIEAIMNQELKAIIDNKGQFNPVLQEQIVNNAISRLVEVSEEK